MISSGEVLTLVAPADGWIVIDVIPPIVTSVSGGQEVASRDRILFCASFDEAVLMVPEAYRQSVIDDFGDVENVEHEAH